MIKNLKNAWQQEKYDNQNDIKWNEIMAQGTKVYADVVQSLLYLSLFLSLLREFLANLTKVNLNIEKIFLNILHWKKISFAIRLLIIRSKLYHVYHNKCNNNYSFVILICLQPFCKQQHLFVTTVWRKSSNHNCSLYIQRVFTQDWLNYYWLLTALSCPLICATDQPD